MSPELSGSAHDECLAVTASIRSKADKHKRRARTATLSMTAATAAIPVFIGLSTDWFWGRVIPSVLAALTAVGAALVGLEKPHERWMLYRRYQRDLEAAELQYRFELQPFDGPDRDKQLAQYVADLQLELHRAWEVLIPSAGDVAAIKPGQAK
jgi:hypothetical protein